MTEKRDNFKRIASNRVNKIIDLISSLENLTNKSFYEYSDEEIELLFNAIQKELNNVKKIFNDKENKKARKFEL